MIVVVEELVDEEVVRADPNRTLIPGSRWTRWWLPPRRPPSYAQGYYDRDNRFYLEWDRISRDPAALESVAGRVGPWDRPTRSTWRSWGPSAGPS